MKFTSYNTAFGFLCEVLKRFIDMDKRNELKHFHIAPLLTMNHMLIRICKVGLRNLVTAIPKYEYASKLESLVNIVKWYPQKNEYLGQSYFN